MDLLEEENDTNQIVDTRNLKPKSIFAIVKFPAIDALPEFKSNFKLNQVRTTTKNNNKPILFNKIKINNNQLTSLNQQGVKRANDIT